MGIHCHFVIVNTWSKIIVPPIPQRSVLVDSNTVKILNFTRNKINKDI